MRRLTCFIAIIIGVMTFANQGQSQTSQRVMSIGLNIEIKSEPLSVGTNELLFWVVPNWMDEALQLKIRPVGNLVVMGNDVIDIAGKKGKREEFIVSFSIPDNDTVGIEIEVRGDGGRYRKNAISRWFVTTSDTVGVYRSKPVRPYQPRWDWPSLEERAAKKERELEHRRRIMNRPVIDTTGSPSYTIRVHPITQQEQMEFMEQSPCTLSGGQSITVDGVYYHRNHGEYKFRKTKFYKSFDEGIADRHHSYTDEEKRTVTKHLVLDLRDPEKYNYALELIGELIPMERAGYYEVTATLAQAEDLSRAKIDMSTYPRYPGDPMPGKAKREKKAKATSQGNDNSENDTDKDLRDEHYIFEYYFEVSPVTDEWRVTDSNSTNGYDYWGYVSDTIGCVGDGFGSAWCAAIGDSPLCQQYDNNMNTTMITKQAIDVSECDFYEVCFSFYQDTEQDYDFFYFWVTSVR